MINFIKIDLLYTILEHFKISNLYSSGVRYMQIWNVLKSSKEDKFRCNRYSEQLLFSIIAEFQVACWDSGDYILPSFRFGTQYLNNCAKQSKTVSAESGMFFT